LFVFSTHQSDLQFVKQDRPMSIDKRLTHQEAAQVIFGTQKPTAAEVDKVQQLIVQCELAGDSRGTTTAAVADFLARRATTRQRVARPSAAEQSLHRVELDTIYHESLKNYFLAVLFRRRIRGASVHFRRAVFGGQVVLLMLMLLAVAVSARTAFPPLAPERAAVVRWLETNAKKPRIIRWHPAMTGSDGRLRVRVEYHYVAESGKGIDTNRVFVIDDGEVADVEWEE
jgi:hypothetical protein